MTAESASAIAGDAKNSPIITSRRTRKKTLKIQMQVQLQVKCFSMMKSFMKRYLFDASPLKDLVTEGGAHLSSKKDNYRDKDMLKEWLTHSCCFS